ncbi:dihydrodipicolinate synthase family protein [Cyclobacterium jeungdonense]|uniref:Dihydrodipicolinate synthase family protein n=1 Tax=Cyclobacterium jeungdonense TaxID=708087 RepID=A0ABT8CAY0_9BACT|nr:dihydrodipicolinate synthase family protein [Cyclobacterium jeungdonense]MDN3688768.1 dihydrodipicolinate synthase family protein [Cyclobacterium jeungdonense]
MKPLGADEIVGVWGTVLLPVQENESIDWGLLDEEIALLMETGLHGIYTNGTAGEFYNQSESEFDTLSEKVAAAAELKGIPFQLGCAHPTPIASLERVKRAKSLHPGALQIILPDWVAPNTVELFRYVEKIALAADPVGLVLYNPPHAKKRLRPEEYRNLLLEGFPIVGCKTAGGDESWYREMSSLPQPFSHFIPGHLLTTGMQLGAKGSYSNIACLHPKAALKWYRMIKANLPEAIEWEAKISLFFREAIFPLIQKEGYSDTAVDKFLAAIGGWGRIGTRLRWPYQGIPLELAMEKRKQLEGILPGFFSIE